MQHRGAGHHRRHTTLRSRADPGQLEAAFSQGIGLVVGLQPDQQGGMVAGQGRAIPPLAAGPEGPIGGLEAVQIPQAVAQTHEGGGAVRHQQGRPPVEHQGLLRLIREPEGIGGPQQQRGRRRGGADQLLIDAGGFAPFLSALRRFRFLKDLPKVEIAGKV
jgi:hypothetical protein